MRRSVQYVSVMFAELLEGCILGLHSILFRVEWQQQNLINALNAYAPKYLDKNPLFALYIGNGKFLDI